MVTKHVQILLFILFVFLGGFGIYVHVKGFFIAACFGVLSLVLSSFNGSTLLLLIALVYAASTAMEYFF